MESSVHLIVVIVALLLASFCFSRITPPFDSGASPPPAPPANPLLHHDLHDSSSSPTMILVKLGFQELATALSPLALSSTPSTVFAPTDSSIHSGFTCSVTSLLRKHIVPGLFSHDLESCRCIMFTSSTDANNVTSTIVVGGVEITRPDFFNNGLVVVQSLQGYVAPLSPFSCNIERRSSLSFPFQPNQHIESHRVDDFSDLNSYISNIMCPGLSH